MITNYKQIRQGSVITVEVTSDLTGVVFFHWYLFGSWQGVTVEPRMTFSLEPGDQNRIVCIDTNDETFDYVANAPRDLPPRVTLFWPRALGEEASHYIVSKKNEEEVFEDIAIVRSQPGRWWYSWLSDRLTDRENAEFGVTPVDQAGNIGDTTFFESLYPYVRRPDAPAYTVTPTADTPPRIGFELI